MFSCHFFIISVKSTIPANKSLRPIKTMLRKFYKREKENIKPFQLRWNLDV